MLIHFQANYLYDCTGHPRTFVIDVPREGIRDSRDVEARLIRHAKANMPISEHNVTFAGIRSDWQPLPSNGILAFPTNWGSPYWFGGVEGWGDC